MTREEAKQKVVEELSKKTNKSKFYFSEIAKILTGMKPREVKQVVRELVEEGILEFWTSGSTSMYGLKGKGKQAAAEGEE